MGQPDNHIDKLDKIITELQTGWMFTSPAPNIDEMMKTLREQARQKLNQYYADFYRNKIPDKKTIDTEHQYEQNTFNKGYNRAVNDITAQFNSNTSKQEGNDE